jgi:hypothetical protein
MLECCAKNRERPWRLREVSLIPFSLDLLFSEILGMAARTIAKDDFKSDSYPSALSTPPFHSEIVVT